MRKLIKGEARVTDDPSGCEYCNVGSDCAANYGVILLVWIVGCILLLAMMDWFVAPLLGLFDNTFLEPLKIFLNS